MGGGGVREVKCLCSWRGLLSAIRQQVISQLFVQEFACSSPWTESQYAEKKKKEKKNG